MLKNVAGQAIGSQVLNASTGGAFVGPVTVYVTGDGGVQTVGQSSAGVCTDEGHGYYSYQPTQAETNYNLIAFTFVGPSAIPATVQVATITEAQASAISTATVTTIIGDGPTRIELLNQLAHRLNKNPPPNMDSATQTRLVSYLNQRQRRLLTMAGLKRLRDATTSMTTVPLQASYGLPALAKLSRMWDPLQGRVLLEMSEQDMRLIAPSGNVNGTPEAFVWTGRQVVAQQPSVPSALFVVSSNGTENTTVLRLEGILASGHTHTTTVQLNGTTPTNVASGISSWARIDKCFLSAPAIGDVTLTEGSPGPALAFIPAGRVSTVYSGFTLYPTPSAAITYQMDITRPVTDLREDTDQAAIPDDFADVLVLGALADEYQHLSDPRWTTAMTEYKERENQLKYWLAETHIGRPFGLARSYSRPSQLGTWFPAGT